MPGRVLIIEDNDTNMELMVYLLRAFGHQTIAAEDGEQGLDLARRAPPDVILCDIQLPGIDGYEVIRQLKEIPALRAIPRVAVTALAMVGDRDKLLTAGFDGYIGKPIQPETFVREMEAFLPAGLASRGPAAAPALTALVQHACRPELATIMLVDDTAANLELDRSILESAGYRVMVAGSVSAALEAARQTRPDLILSDVDMPKRDGYDLLRECSADSALSSIPFVFISSTSSVLKLSHPMQKLGLGHVKLIIRPIDAESLLAEIASSLHKARGVEIVGSVDD